MSSLNNDHPLVREWGYKKYLYSQRLGEWMTWARARSGEKMRPIVLHARDLGQSLSTSTISEMEALREYDPADEHEPPRGVNLLVAMFLAMYYGHPVDDLMRYMLTGKHAVPNDVQRLVMALMMLPDADRADVESFIAYRQQQASARTLDRDAETPAPRRASQTSQPTPTPQGDPTTAPRR